MSLADLIRKRPSVEFANDNPAKAAKDGQVRDEPLAGLAPLSLANPPDDETDALPDPAAEARRRRVLAMLAQHPGTRYAVLTDTEADLEAVLLTLAIRDKGSCELSIPREKYDPFLLLDLIERHTSTATLQ